MTEISTSVDWGGAPRLFHTQSPGNFTPTLGGPIKIVLSVRWQPSKHNLCKAPGLTAGIYLIDNAKSEEVARLEKSLVRFADIRNWYCGVLLLTFYTPSNYPP
jgi:hypothetical protein